MTNIDPKHLDALVGRLKSPWANASPESERGPIPEWIYSLIYEAAEAITALRAQIDQERAATIEAAAKACEACAPDPAGGAASHTNSMRVIAFDCRNKVAKLHTDATRAAMDAIRREGYEAGMREERAKSDELANAARDLADCCQLGEDADWEEGDDPLSVLRAILAARS